MKLKKILATALFLLGIAVGYAIESLPKVEIQGKEYYYYEVKKDDSLYGIAKRFGWDEATLKDANPSSYASLKRGQRIYYPVKAESVGEENAPTIVQKPEYSDVYHEVKRGETVYSIALMYGLTQEDIYQNNPSSKFGIKVGEKLKVQHSGENVDESEDSSVVYYTIKENETLLDIAQEYATSVEDILRSNPGLTENNFSEGTVVRLHHNSDRENIQIRDVEVRQVSYFEPYKIQKNDTWTSISNSHNITIEELRAANEGVEQLKKGRFLSIPVYEIVAVQEEFIDEDPREQTLEGRRELYEEVHNVGVEENDSASIDVGIILTVNDNRNREGEFLRGVMIAMDEIKNNGYKVNLSVFDATSEKTPIDTILSTPKVKELDLIITTFDKNFPQQIAEFGEMNDVNIVNVFDVKNDLFNTHSKFIQLLSPTSYFNNAIFNYVIENFSSREFIFVGKSSNNDSNALDNMLKECFAAQDIKFTSIEHIEQLESVGLADNDTEYVICPLFTKRAEIDSFVSTLSTIMENAPGIKLSVLARPNWIVYADRFNDKFAAFNTFIPSRFFYNPNDIDTRSFEKSFNDKFGEYPVKSNPVYAALGYDVIRFFVESEHFNSSDYNNGFVNYDALQTDFHLNRVTNWSGFLNRCAYIINYTPSGTIEKITLN